MMRAAVVRSRPLFAAGAGRPARSLQWPSLSHPRPLPSSSRGFADEKKPDEIVLPNAAAAPGAPPAAPLTSPAATPTSPTVTAPEANVPKTPPTPLAVGAVPPSPATTVAGTAASTPPPAPRRRRRSRVFLYLFALLVAGYGGSVYYALVNDNFHDFFTEYIPFGEEAVLFFEEREFKRRFPGGSPSARPLYPQTSGEPKVTVSQRSGVSAKVSESASKPVSQPDRAVVGVAAKVPSAGQAADKVKSTVQKGKEDVKSAAAKTADAVKPSTAPPSSSEPSSGGVVPLIDNLKIDNAADPVVQEISKILNDLITVINADSAGSKYSSAVEKAKDSVTSLASSVASFRDLALRAAEQQKTQDQADFDKGAQELLRRIEAQQQDQELKLREEWEAERDRLSKSYADKLHAEVEAMQKISDQRLKNELLDQATKLQDSFSSSVRDTVEHERSGRLSKLNDLSSSVAELEKLTSEWTKVLDSNLKTQHLVVAVDAVRSVVEDAEHSKPFIHELAALKDIAQDDAVVDAAIGSIKPTAYQRGLPTAAQLIDRFRRVAFEVRKASLLPEDAGAASHAASFVLSRVMFKKQGLATGDDVESILTRTETFLEEGNLDEAAREMNSLQGWAKVLSRDWLAECRTVLEAKQAVEVIATQAKLQSLLVE